MAKAHVRGLRERAVHHGQQRRCEADVGGGLGGETGLLDEDVHRGGDVGVLRQHPETAIPKHGADPLIASRRTQRRRRDSERSNHR